MAATGGLHRPMNRVAEFRGLFPGYNRNPSRGFVEKWLAKRERTDRCIDWAARIGALAIAVLGAATAF